jgi:DNA-binding beta-propeller fold protein YncE
MLKKSIILIFFLQLSGCPIQGGEVKTTSIENKTPTPFVSVTPSPEEKYQDLEIYSEPSNTSKGVYCEPISNLKTELKYPLKIAVSKDGDNVFIVNGKCKRQPFLPENFTTNEICQNENGDENIVQRNSILKITKENNIDIVRYNNQPLFSCSLSGEIETDLENNLFVANNNNSIFKLSKEKQLTKIAEIKEHYGYCYPPPGKICELPYLSGPANIYIDQNNLYFLMYIISEYGKASIKKLDQNGNVFNVFNSNITRLIPFSINKDKIYVLNGTQIKEYVTVYNESGSDVKVVSEKVIADLFKYFFYRKNTIYDHITKILVNSKDEIFINDITEHYIWKIVPGNGIDSIRIFAGNGKSGFKDGKGEIAEFNYPADMDFDAHDNLYVADTGNNAIRKITPDGTVTTFYKELTF